MEAGLKTKPVEERIGLKSSSQFSFRGARRERRGKNTSTGITRKRVTKKERVTEDKLGRMSDV